MSILTRFKDIISSNVNAMLDKAEDPAKMVDQYLRKMSDDLAVVKKETAGVMAEESRTKRLVDENLKEVAKYNELAKKALVAGNEDDARSFLTKKQELEAVGASLEVSYAAAHENAIKMRQMHDKLVKDISQLNMRRQAVKVKVAVAKTQEHVNKAGASAGKIDNAGGAFTRMEAKADAMLDRANAMAELDTAPIDPVQALEDKYNNAATDDSVNDEIAALKAQLGL